MSTIRRLAHSLKQPKTQLGLAVGSFVASVVLWAVAAVLKWLALVEFVSHVSMAALVLSSLSGIASALVLLDAATGTNTTKADRRWFAALLAPLLAEVKALRAEAVVLRAEIAATHRELRNLAEAVNG